MLKKKFTKLLKQIQPSISFKWAQKSRFWPYEMVKLQEQSINKTLKNTEICEQNIHKEGKTRIPHHLRGWRI